MSTTPTRPRTPNWRIAPERIRLTPDVVTRFARYHDLHLAWGALHVVLDDGNVHDRFCADLYDAPEDLADMLCRMSPTQRRRLGAVA